MNSDNETRPWTLYCGCPVNTWPSRLTQAVRYNLEGCGFDFRCGHCSFLIHLIFRYGFWVNSTSNRNEYKEYLLLGGGKDGR
jgi:hypothetical protein